MYCKNATVNVLNTLSGVRREKGIEFCNGSGRLRRLRYNYANQ